MDLIQRRRELTVEIEILKQQILGRKLREQLDNPTGIRIRQLDRENHVLRALVAEFNELTSEPPVPTLQVEKYMTADEPMVFVDKARRFYESRQIALAIRKAME